MKLENKIAIVVFSFLTFLAIGMQNCPWIDADYKETIRQTKINDFNGIVSDHHRSKGVYFLTLKDGKRLIFSVDPNKAYSPSDFDAFVQDGDSIIRHKGVDSMFIIRNGYIYKWRN
jgi:hypothetical protein